MIASLYAAGARGRRRYYARRPYLQRRLAHPVISIGNLAVGGRAKTPLAAWLAARLVAMGERPAILSRGYARRDRRDGVVVVRDPNGIRADLDRSGDEPLMLARRLDGVSVIVSSDRYLAGRLAEHHLGATVHVLDDGFQHFTLHRDADLLVVAREDIENPRTLPAGRLREPMEAAAAASALLALGDGVTLQRLPAAGQPSWQLRRRLEPVRTFAGRALDAAAGPIVAVAGTAEPAAFFRDLRQAGWRVARELPFRDHHRFTATDVDALVEAVRATGAQAIVTTEKDAVRLLPFRPLRVEVGFAPLHVEVEDASSFDLWLRRQLARP